MVQPTADMVGASTNGAKEVGSRKDLSIKSEVFSFIVSSHNPKIDKFISDSFSFIATSTAVISLTGININKQVTLL